MKQLNWKPVIGSLLRILQDHNFTLHSVHDGEDDLTLEGTDRQRRQEAKDVICGVDVADLYVTHPSVDGIAMLIIILGNEPEETVADHSAVVPLNQAVDQFSKKWQGRPCPIKYEGSEYKSQVQWEALGRETIGRANHSLDPDTVTTPIPMWHYTRTRPIKNGECSPPTNDNQ